VTAISGLLAEVDLQREILAKRAEGQNQSERKVPCTNTQYQCFCMAKCFVTQRILTDCGMKWDAEKQMLRLWFIDARNLKLVPC
jgi:hypothetical protein